MENSLTFILGWLSSLSGVFLGGWLVYRTKRDPHESLLQMKQPAGEAFVLDEGLGMEPISEEAKLPPEIVARRTADFLKQLHERKASGS